ncbi:hypothetical protein Droror1_Dr00000885 [Drosera rotundifolia]
MLLRFQQRPPSILHLLFFPFSASQHSLTPPVHTTNLPPKPISSNQSKYPQEKCERTRELNTTVMVMTRSKRKVTQRAEEVEKRFKAEMNQQHQQHQIFHLRVKPLRPTVDPAGTQKLPQPFHMVPAPQLGSLTMPRGVNKCGNLNGKTPTEATDKPLSKTAYDIPSSAKQVYSSRKIESPRHHLKDPQTGGLFTLKFENQPKQVKTRMPTMEQVGIQKLPQPSYMMPAQHLASSTMPKGVDKCRNQNERTPETKDAPLLKIHHDIPVRAEEVSQSKDAHAGGFFTQKVENQPKQVSPPRAQYVPGSLRARRVPCRLSSLVSTHDISIDEAADADPKSRRVTDGQMSQSTAAESKKSALDVPIEAKISPVTQEITIGENDDLDSKSRVGTDVQMSQSMAAESTISASDVPLHGEVVVQALRVTEASINFPEKQEKTLALAGKGGYLKRTRSLNLTEMAADCGDCDDDAKEVSSKSLVTLYKIKPELATILEEILEKYGDIAANCVKRSKISRSCLLENVCEIVLKLKEGQLMHLSLSDVDGMLELLDDIEADKVVVGWLRQRVDEIKKAVQLLGGYLEVKKAEEASRLVIDNKEKEIVELLKRLKATKDELKMARLENKAVLSTISETRITELRFHGKSMITDLL